MSAQTDGSLTAVHRRLQMVRRMRVIHRVCAMLPFPHGDTPDAIPSRQGAHPFRACCNLRAYHSVVRAFLCKRSPIFFSFPCL
jgi:hypothetical protein